MNAGKPYSDLLLLEPQPQNDYPPVLTFTCMTSLLPQQQNWPFDGSSRDPMAIHGVPRSEGEGTQTQADNVDMMRVESTWSSAPDFVRHNDASDRHQLIAPRMPPAWPYYA